MSNTNQIRIFGRLYDINTLDNIIDESCGYVPYDAIIDEVRKITIDAIKNNEDPNQLDYSVIMEEHHNDQKQRVHVNDVQSLYRVYHLLKQFPELTKQEFMNVPHEKYIYDYKHHMETEILRNKEFIYDILHAKQKLQCFDFICKYNIHVNENRDDHIIKSMKEKTYIVDTYYKDGLTYEYFHQCTDDLRVNAIIKNFSKQIAYKLNTSENDIVSTLTNYVNDNYDYDKPEFKLFIPKPTSNSDSTNLEELFDQEIKKIIVDLYILYRILKLKPKMPEITFVNIRCRVQLHQYIFSHTMNYVYYDVVVRNVDCFDYLRNTGFEVASHHCELRKLLVKRTDHDIIVNQTYKERLTDEFIQTVIDQHNDYIEDVLSKL